MTPLGTGTRQPAILNASGCLDALTAAAVARSLDAYVTKTVTPEPRDGNAPVRIVETDVGMLNSIGLANPGIEAFVRDTLPRVAELGVPIWVSVGGFSSADYGDVCGVLDGHEEVAALELNLSCPNVDSPAESVADIVETARRATGKPLYAKLSPGVGDIAGLARAAVGAGADGLALINTVRGLALDPRTLRPRLGTATGGLSGPALRPVALASVFSCFQAAAVPIVGMGGVATGDDALALLAAGASGIALGTVLFTDPGAAHRVRRELRRAAAAAGLDDPWDAFGRAHADRNPPVELKAFPSRKRLDMGEKVAF